MRIDALPRFPLAHLPTPLEELKTLSRQFAGPTLLIKRDDQTGLALGGNKTHWREARRGQ
jgi:D-cysteine desulfhydrase